MSIAITESDTAKTKATTIAVNIFGVADGLRPRAVIEAKLEAMITAVGPRIHKVKISTSAKLRSTKSLLSLLHDRDHFVGLDLGHAAGDLETVFSDKYYTTDQTAQKRFMKGQNFKNPHLPGKNDARHAPLKERLFRCHDQNIQHLRGPF